MKIRNMIAGFCTMGIVVCLLFSLSGCGHFLKIPDLKDPVPEEALKHLSEDRWRENSDWTPAEVVENPTADRWVFDSPKVFDPETLERLVPEDSIIGRNAALLLGKNHQPEALRTLEGLVFREHDQLSLRMRQAAAEVLGNYWSWRLVASGGREPPDSLTASALNSGATGSASVSSLLLSEESGGLRPPLAKIQNSSIPESVKRELLLGLARSVPPSESPELSNALIAEREGTRVKLAPVEERRNLIEACAIHAALNPHAPNTAFPAAISRLENDPDPRVRRVYAQFVSFRKDPDAEVVLERMLHDLEPSVAAEGFVSLGRLKSDSGLARLWQELQDPTSANQVAAVQGLAYYGELELVRLVDSNPAIQTELARQLARFQSSLAANGLKQLFATPNMQVQLAALDGTSSWPDRLAFPLLLHALDRGLTRVRQLALVELEKRLGESVPFPLTGTEKDRQVSLAQLRNRLGIKEAISHSTQTGEESPDHMKDPDAPETERQRIRVDLELALSGEESDRQQALERLTRLSPRLVPIVEAEWDQASTEMRALLWTAVLPNLDPRYRAAQELDAGNSIETRRQAAQRLCATEEPLSPILVEYLCDTMPEVQDAAIWRSILTSLRKQSDPRATELAVRALTQSWSDIQILGCQFIESKHDPELARPLLPLLDQSEPLLCLAAIKAAQACGNPIVIEGVPGLRPLLQSQDLRIRLAAAIALSSFGDERGMRTLEGLARDSNPDLRDRAIQGIGSTGQASFVPFLIRLGWTEPQPEATIPILDSLEQLVPIENRPAGWEERKKPSRTLERWAAWSKSSE